MKIYTKTGDKGETALLGGKRVLKSCLEMEAIGEVDELNAFLGIVIEEIEENFKTETKKLKDVQKDLFVIGAELAAVQMQNKIIKKISGLKVKQLEKWIDKMEKDLPKLHDFISYEGSEEAVKVFYARAICRRAERVVIKLDQQLNPPPNRGRLGGGLVSPQTKQYLNRLSDLLFVLGRWFNCKTGKK